ncbi:MAG: CrcB family protein [Ruminococcaceae bacterium]|nr:CrcB family protein [Oscillospiraceae bacterium]
MAFQGSTGCTGRFFHGRTILCDVCSLQEFRSFAFPLPLLPKVWWLFWFAADALRAISLTAIGERKQQRMKKVASVGIGGAVGAICRHLIQMIPILGGEFYRPVLTMAINISGSFLLGFLVILFVRLVPVSAELRTGITSGVIGGYTTFSTLCKETVFLFDSGYPLLSCAYLFFSVTIGLTAAWLGIRAAKRLERRFPA